MSFYKQLAKYYDMIYSGKDYAGEVDIIHEIISSHCTTSGNDLLEVACGTGKHIEFFKKYYNVIGSDINQDMIDIAKENYPEIEFFQSDMTSLKIDRKFDAITCLFGSISYLPTLEDLSRTMKSFSDHLLSGGVAIIEPFLFPEVVNTNHVAMTTIDEPELKIARVNTVYLEGDYLLIPFHFVIGTPKGVEHFEDTHKMFLFTKEMFESAITSAGLEYHHIHPEGTRAGFIIGKKV